ncbi:MAG TPA: replication initiation protein [Smithellaceae bacterium]|nr:replication initiation protein [Smithellaceae bacterium]
MANDENKKEKNYQVVQSNPLVEAQYKLDLMPQKLIRYLVSLIKPSDEHFEKKYYRLYARDFAKLMETDNKGIYKDIKKTAELLKRSTVIYKKEKSTLHANWLASYEYHDGEGWIEFEFSSKLETELLNIKGKFTKYQLLHIAKLKSQYAIRIYELLLQYRNYGQREIPLDELKANLGIKQSEYKLFGKFKQSVLDVAHREITGKTDLSYTWRPKKHVRKVVSVIFEDIKVRTTIPPWLIGALPKKYRTNERVFDSIREWLPKRGEDYIKEKIEYTTSKNPGNYADYLYKALEGDFGKGFKAAQSDILGPKVGYPSLLDGTILQSVDGTTIIIEGGAAKAPEGYIPINQLRKDMEVGKYRIVDLKDTNVNVTLNDDDADVIDVVAESEGDREEESPAETKSESAILPDGTQIRIGDRFETVKNGAAGGYSRGELIRMIKNGQAEISLAKPDYNYEELSSKEPSKAKESEGESASSKESFVEHESPQMDYLQEEEALGTPLGSDDDNKYAYYEFSSSSKPSSSHKKVGKARLSTPKHKSIDMDATLLQELLQAFKEGRIVIKPPNKEEKGKAIDSNKKDKTKDIRQAVEEWRNSSDAEEWF